MILVLMFVLGVLLIVSGLHGNLGSILASVICPEFMIEQG